MSPEDAPVRRAQAERRGDKFGAPQAHDLAAQQSRHASPGGDSEGDQQAGEAAPQDGHQRNQEQGGRKSIENVHQAHDERIGPAAPLTGQAAQRAAHEQNRRLAGKTDDQRQASAKQQAAENITALFIRAKPMLRTGRRARLIEIGRQRVERRQQRRQQRRQNQRQQIERRQEDRPLSTPGAGAGQAGHRRHPPAN